ncbi:hypothetical protein OKA04_16865 [Luteolibacter flavescens]|uniref:Verru_Chthon cassette protein A n=1 Tax=Luteolibacter flavescens TaxID=1859460 RepID=A0ABT3FS82_9BACT|nr:hypothetical protein [Luteolibacter flavescens]MCW1886412.1 hypothetical protein [Luteolibacter flavescens]
MIQNLTLPSKASRPRGPRGFALVISLSLMVLLTVLAVGLLSLSSISLRSSSRGDAMASARANARMALMFAIGELQAMTGPDQRVTATADIAGTATGDPVAAGVAPLNNNTVNSTQKGLSAVQPGTRHWTGVWNNQTGTFVQSFTRTPTPNILGWLVSGNENKSDSNRLTPADSIAAVDGGGEVDTKSAVVLAGKNTVGSSQTDDYVSAPLVEIEDSGNGKAPSGRHAWWIGDEGVKAKLNLATPTGGDNAQISYAKLAAPRRGWETVDGFGNYPTPGSGNEQLLTRVVTSNEVALLDSALAGTSDTPLQRNFHAATADSYGVLADVAQGGLKLDLSNYLAGTLPTTAMPGVLNSPVANMNIIPSSVAPRIRGPKWSALKDFTELSDRLESGNLRPANSDLQAAIAPIITDFRMLFGARLVAKGGDNYTIQPCVKIAVALANPYPYPLKWTTPLQLEVKNHVPTPARGPTFLRGAANSPSYLPRNPSSPAVLNGAIFTIPATTLPPGEARAFTMNNSLVRPAGVVGTVTIPLANFSSSSPSNFGNSVFLDHGGINTMTGTPLRLDVNEDATTTQINVELRSGGSTSTLLRKIERFELDNSMYQQTYREFTAETAKRYTEAVPLQFYSFQLSQPGADYASVLPTKDQLGLRSSTVRTFADFNLQATRFRKPIISYNPPPYFMQIANSTATLPFTPPGKDTGSDFTRNLSVSPMPWGRSPFDSRQTILFSPPEQFVSLAQFQHADLTADDIYVSVAHQPGNAVGNSYATPFVMRRYAVQNRTDFTITDFNNASGASTNYYDMSYLLNTALWDTYYFSTIPRSGSPTPLNDRLVVWNPSDTTNDLQDGQQAAARLLVNGAHNVNSVEKEAWKALLAGSKHLSHPADDGGSGDALYPRSLEQISSSEQPPTGSGNDSFSGFRRLTDAQIDEIATEITRQVRMRGPFVSMSHFVNRALVPFMTNRDLSRSGALQSALDIAGANISPDGTKSIFTDLDIVEDRVNLQSEGSSPRADIVGDRATTLPNTGGSSSGTADGTWPPTSFDLNPGSMASIIADRQMLSDQRYKSEQGFRSTGIPGWITQADLLQVLGPSLTARSDTFRIRAYGESLDPTTGNPVAKAWCEAIVQRLPEYLDPIDAPTVRTASLTSEVNQRFGRRYEIVSFRWLSPNEI